MKKFPLLSFCLLTLAYSSIAQTDSLSVKKINKISENYAAYVQIKNELFALTDSGKIVIWDLKKIDTIHFPYNTSNVKYVAIEKDHDNNVFVATKNGGVFKLNPSNLSFTPYLQVKYPIQNILINTDNKIYLIMGGAVYDAQTHKYWDQFENHSKGLISITRKRKFIFFHSKKVNTKYLATPQYTFVDSKDNFWMTAVYGEFGGEVEVFDSHSDTIVNNKFGNIYPGSLSPRSVFEDNNGNIYITCGVQHFINFGEIYRIDDKRNIVKIFNGEVNPGEKVFVGPGAFNKADHKIYFVTTSGFYKADIASNYIKPELIFNTNLSWTREPMAIGVDMSVRKLDFTMDDRLLFLTKNDGFGIYDGKCITFFK